MFTLQIKLFLVSAFELPKLFGLVYFFFFYSATELTGPHFYVSEQRIKNTSVKGLFNLFSLCNKTGSV